MTLRLLPGPLARRRVTALLASLLYLFLALLMLALAADQVAQYLGQNRGVETGRAIVSPSPVEPAYGVNIVPQQYRREEDLRGALRTAALAGLTTVRVEIPWSEVEPSQGRYHWALWDATLPVIRDEGFYVVAVLNQSPLWARSEWEAMNPYAPPSDMSGLAAFAGLVAERYGIYIGAYQVWDEPNISPHWGSGAIAPAGYVDMLAQVSHAIRAEDPDATIITGALAPNTESGGRNMSDLLFVRELYRLEAQSQFDVLGVKAFGFWSGPDDRRVDADVLNLSRLVLLREEMRRWDAADTPVWAVDGGWAALPEDWEGELPAQGADVPLIQGTRLDLALERMEREWPWLGLICLHTLQPDAPADDPAWGYALLDPDGRPTALYGVLQDRLMSQRVLYPGLTNDLEPYLIRAGGVDQYRMTFWGSDLELAVVTGAETGQIQILVDDARTVKSISLDADEASAVWVRLAAFLPVEEHDVRITGTSAQLSAVRGIRVARRQIPWTLIVQLTVAGMLAAWCVVMAVQQAKQIPWRVWWSLVCERWARLPRRLRIAALGVCFVAMGALPWWWARLAVLAAYGVLSTLSPEGALLIAVLSVPLAPVTVRLGPGSFSVTEIGVLVAAAARLWDGFLRGEYAPRRWRTHLARLQWPDMLVVGLVILGLVTAPQAAYRREALREFRVVVLESAIMYALVRDARHRLGMSARLVDALFVSGVAVAIYGLLRYPLASGVIEAEGVRRARAFFGSPNNLALYLERVFPLGICAALGSRSAVRRWVYGLGGGAMLLLIVLTYSRGALLLGVPAALLTIGLFTGKRVRWAMVGILALGIAVVIPLMGVQRLVSLVDTTQGTTFLRLSLWSAAAEMIADHPWRGVGLDNFLYYYGDYIREGAQVDRWLSHPHDLFLDFWVRLGIGGVAAILGLIAAVVTYGRRARLAANPAGSAMVPLGLLAGMAAALAHGLIDSFYFVPELACWFMFALAWLVNASDSGVEDSGGGA